MKLDARRLELGNIAWSASISQFIQNDFYYFKLKAWEYPSYGPKCIYTASRFIFEIINLARKTLVLDIYKMVYRYYQGSGTTRKILLVYHTSFIKIFTLDLVKKILLYHRPLLIPCNYQDHICRKQSFYEFEINKNLNLV